MPNVLVLKQKMRQVIAVAVATFVLTAASAFAGEVMTPEAGTPLRKALLNTLRPSVQDELGMRILFKVDEIRTDGEWAYVSAVPLKQSGGRIDYSQTEFARGMEEGYFDDWLCSLLKRREGGAWEVVALSIGATHAPFADWPYKFGVPDTVVPGEP